MSNLQDIPLGDQGLPVDGPEVAPTPKSNSLKRFFKISKKPLMRDQVEDDDDSSSQDNKELGKSNTISRFFTRLKGANKDGQEASGSAVDPVEHEKPLPNAKPTIKTSISSYWKLLFNRQKSQRQTAVFGQSNNSNVENESEEIHELQPVNQDPDADSQPTARDEQEELEDGVDAEPANPKLRKIVASKASDQQILSALEGGQLSTTQHEDDAGSM
ncbi:uncharacterized protein LOC6553816 [Drosophila erecta]|uniref:GG16074 n=1 Tax=Drosophila erecta TaxID=7220 RepID=B3P355_DROER|nr:uncharacterized protein LOC6553816 [Drosophila erecta]EDV48507.1 uncharacterized protein Dere_GG16074 [Drosophila erecta]